jgi:predicted nucleic acid-binding protein
MSESETRESICFIDSNIWLYAFVDGSGAQKSARAKQLLQTKAKSIVISSQVINEVCANLIRKGKIPETTIRQLIGAFYGKYPVVVLNEDLQIVASVLREEYSFSFWDSLIVSAALNSGAQVLYSEDMQAGQVIRGQLTVENPFQD